jgi:hypothetical protein
MQVAPTCITSTIAVTTDTAPVAEV